MAKQTIKKAGNGRAKPLVAKVSPTKSKGRRYSCGGKLTTKKK